MKQLLCCWFYCPHGFLLWVSKTRHMIITLIDILSLSLPLSLCLSVCLSTTHTHTHTHKSERETETERDSISSLLFLSFPYTNCLCSPCAQWNYPTGGICCYYHFYHWLSSSPEPECPSQK
jgi:hypothetical protein